MNNLRRHACLIDWGFLYTRITREIAFLSGSPSTDSDFGEAGCGLRKL